MSLLVISKDMMNSLKQGNSDESTGRSTVDDGPKKFWSLTKIYADIVEEELDSNKLVLLSTK